MYKKIFILSFIMNIVLGIVVAALMANKNTPEEKKIIKTFRAVNNSLNKKMLIKQSKEIENISTQIIKEISKDWTPEVLIKKIDPIIAKKIGKQKMKQLTLLYKRLGKYKKHSNSSIAGYPMRPNSIIVSIQADFEKGKALVKLVLKKQKKTWIMEGINIESEVFLADVIKKSKK